MVEQLKHKISGHDEQRIAAEFSVWTGQMRRFVRRSAKGIAVIRLIDNKPTLRYVFDAADTQAAP